ncbi:trypsin-like serine protease [Streptomyces sp. NPDC001941]|uniref:trypsin-like serine protease n=1 Tax=Streptomyces sp. NPDC001941 TaxID=3154659 RepID=UPI00332589D3
MAPPAEHPALERVAEVIVRSPAGGWSYGTGYLLGSRTILTARHLLGTTEPTGTVSVRLAGDATLHPADVAWRTPEDDSDDLALLRLSGEPPRPRSRHPDLGTLRADPARTVEVTVTGFPAFAGVTDPAGGDVRDSYQVTAEIATHTFTKTRRLELRPHARPRTLGARWRGLSGGAVFAEGSLVGVVVAAEPDAPALHATPVSALQGDPRIRRILADDGVSLELRPVRRPTRYGSRILQLAAHTGELHDRAEELADLEAFARSDQPYRWVIGPPWAGKTALAARFAARPPDGVDVVAFFVSRSFGEQTRQFQQEVCDQLAALVDEPPGVFSGQSALDDLWARASAQAAATGRHLLLLVDGLDENDESPSIAALLPAETGAYGHVLVLGRENPPVPAAVPRSHPLRTEHGCPRIRLAPTPYANRLRERATDELAAVLPDRQARAVLGTLAVGGPMTVDDLADALGAGAAGARRAGARALVDGAGALGTGALSLDAYDVRTVVDSVSSRVLSSLGEGSTQRFGFAHDELRRATVEAVGPTAAARHRAALHAWASDFDERGWPDDTPDYLVLHYPAVAMADPDPSALAALPSPGRVAMWQRRTGHDGSAVQEITDVLHALPTAGPEALRAACLLAMRRYRLLEVPADPSSSFPVAIVTAWAERGQWPRAEYLASVIWHSATAYADLAAVAARTGDLERAHRLVQRARAASARDQAGSVWHAPSVAALAPVMHRAGAPATARDLLREAEHLVHVAPPSPGTDLMAVALARVAEAHAATGDPAEARRVALDAERLADGSGSRREDLLPRIAFGCAVARGFGDALRSFPRPRTPVGLARVYAEFTRAAAHAEGADLARTLLARGERALGALPAHGASQAGDSAPPSRHGREPAHPRQRIAALLDLAESAVAVDAAHARRLAEEVEGSLTSSAAGSAVVRLAEVQQRLGRTEHAVALIHSLPDGAARLQALVRCAEAAHDAGADEDARGHLERAEPMVAALEEPRRQGDVRTAFAIAVARAGDPERAERVLRDTSPPREHFWEALALTEAIARQGRFEQTEALFALGRRRTDQTNRTAARLAHGAGRFGDPRRVEALADRCDTEHRYLVLREGALGAAEGGHFKLVGELLDAAGRALRGTARVARLGIEHDVAGLAAIEAVERGETRWAEALVRLIGHPGGYMSRTAQPVAHAVRGDLDAAERAARAVGIPPDRAEALTAVARIAAARGEADRADRLIDQAGQAAAGWTDAAAYARSRIWSRTAVGAALIGRTSRADELLRLLADASPDHRVPALAARATAHARDGSREEALALLDEAFSCLSSRAGGADAERALTAFVVAAREVDLARCRTYVVRLLATWPRTPAYLPAAVLTDPGLAALAVRLLADEPARD